MKPIPVLISLMINSQQNINGHMRPDSPTRKPSYHFSNVRLFERDCKHHAHPAFALPERGQLVKQMRVNLTKYGIKMHF